MPAHAPILVLAAVLAAGADSGAAPLAGAVTAPAPAVPPETPSDLAGRVNALVEKLKDPASRKAARREIIAIGKDATPALVARARDPDFTVRWEMANIQGDLNDPRALPMLADNVLHDENPHVRWRSMWAINTYDDKSAAVATIRAALTSEDEAERWNAAVGCSMVGETAALPLIHAGLAQADEWRRWEAVNALSRINDATSARHLEPVVTASKVVKERNEAVLALGKIPGEDAFALLVRALGDAAPDVRWRAAMSLGTRRDPRAREPLATLVETEKDPQVLEHARRALEVLGRVAK